MPNSLLVLTNYNLLIKTSKKHSLSNFSHRI